MAQDLNSLLQAFTELTQASRQPGKMTREQLEAEVRRLTAELQKTLANLSSQLKSGDTPESAYMVEVFQAQIRNIIDSSGLKGVQQAIEPEEETEQLSQDVEKLKRGPVRT
jgi:hypothetical protein